MATTTLSSAKLKKVLAALEANWQAEMEGYHTYNTLADRDSDPVRAQVLRHLAGAEWEPLDRDQNFQLEEWRADHANECPGGSVGRRSPDPGVRS